MNEALCSILCKPYGWWVNPHIEDFIDFNEDGTGEMWCRQDFTYVFVVNLEWRSLGVVESSDADARSSGVAGWFHGRKPQLLGQLKLQIRLDKSVGKSWGGPLPSDYGPNPNEYFLLEAAFQPKTFIVTLEKGEFVSWAYQGHDNPYEPHFSLRLLFDRSPFPPKSEWDHSKGGPLYGAIWWELTEFVARSLPTSESQGRAMNDVDRTGWGDKCVVS